MLKGFKDFLMRGNVVELATAVIVGAAFTAIVTAFTEKIINPLIAVIPTGDCPQPEGGSKDFICGFGFAIDSSKPATFMDFGAVISAFINFVIVAAVVYFLIVVPYNKLQELRKLEDGEEDPDEEIVLLTQIRNALDPEAKERDAAAKAKAEAEKAAEEARQRPPQAPPAPPAAPPAAPAAPAPGYGDRTQTMQVPPQHQSPQGQPQAQQGFTPPAGPPTGGYPTPNPAPGEYPPPGNLPPGQYAPGQYPPAPGQDPGDAPRHQR